MVRGLTVGIYHGTSGISPEIKYQELPHPEGQNPRVIIDGISLAYHVLSPIERDHSIDFVNGGDYHQISLRIIDYISRLQKYNFEITVVLPLQEGVPPVTPEATERLLAKQEDKLHRVMRVKTMLEKAGSLSRNLTPVLPPLVILELLDVLKTLQTPVKILYTINNITRFCAKYVVDGNADAVIAQNSDFLIFKGVNYIPMDSLYTDENKDLKFDLLNDEKTASILGLTDPSRLITLSVLLGNPFTDAIINNKYNIPNLLHIKVKPQYPDAIVNGIVQWLNSPDFESLSTTTPIAEIVGSDPAFAKTIDESNVFFDLSTPFLPETDDKYGKIRALVDESKLPLWVYPVALGADSIIDPIVDDYDNDVRTLAITTLIRKILYGILGRKSVIERVPVKNSIESVEMIPDEGLPFILDLLKLSAEKRATIYHRLAHGTFPVKLAPTNTKKKPDLLEKLPQPFRLAGQAIRLVIAQCFTDNQTELTKCPDNENGNALKELGYIGAPLIDMFELKTLIGTVIVLNSQKTTGKFESPVIKPKLRRIRVSAYYQSALQYLIALQQCFGLFDENSRPHRLYDGEVFAALYEAFGSLENDSFTSLFQNSEKVPDLAQRVDDMMKAILAPFDERLFDTFKDCPRSLGTLGFEEEPKTVSIKAATSAFAGLLDSDSEDDEDYVDDQNDQSEAVQEEPKEEPKDEVKPIALPPPPPKNNNKNKKGKGKGQKQEEPNEDDELAFLMAQAAANASKEGEQKIVSAKDTKKPKKVHVRKQVDGGPQGKQNFTSESKAEMKRQLKQQALGIYE
jgi:hypothetical protein